MSSPLVPPAKPARFVTFRSLAFGALGLFMIAGLSGFHDWVLRGTSMVGNQMPASAFFYFMFLGVVWNGGCGLLDRITRTPRGYRAFRFAGLALFAAVAGLWAWAGVTSVAPLPDAGPFGGGVAGFVFGYWFFRFLAFLAIGAVLSALAGLVARLAKPRIASMCVPRFAGHVPLFAAAYVVGAGLAARASGGTVVVGWLRLAVVGLVLAAFWEALDWPARARDRRSFGGTYALSMRELIFVMLVTLVSCYAPTSGLMRYFNRQLMLPWYFRWDHGSWQEQALLTEYLRPELFPAPWPGPMTNASEGLEPAALADYARVYRGFFDGLMQGTERVALWDLPLLAWARPLLLFWGPLVLLLVLSLVSLQFLVHRQWASHEQLAYPLAQVAGSFCRTKDGRPGVPEIFSNRLFWWGCLPVFVLLGLSYLSAFYPESVPSLQSMLPNLRSWDVPLTTKIPILAKVPGAGSLNGQTLYFTFFGIAYFVSSEISLTVGLSAVLVTLFGLFFYSSTGMMFEGGILDSSRAGAYVGYSLILLYTGRAYFKAVFGRAFGLRRRRADGADDPAAPDEVSVLAARVLVVAFLGFVVVLAWMCQSWLMAVFYSLLLMVLYLVVSRIVCETGIPFLQAGWHPSQAIVNLVGPAAVGPKSLPFMLWSTAILTQDPRESLMPYVGNGVKIADDAGVKLRKVFWIVVAAVVAAVVVAFFANSWTFYNHGAWGDGWADRWTPHMYLDEAARHFNTMKVTGVFAASESAGALGRLALAQSTPIHAHYMLYGLLAVLAVSALRFRFSRFPLHPVLFLVAGTMPSQGAWFSFLLGWAVKQLVVRFGGGGVYKKFKPFFVGLIAGEILIVGASILVDFLHYWIFGTVAPVRVRFLPG